jgi:hypothetical protein
MRKNLRRAASGDGFFLESPLKNWAHGPRGTNSQTIPHRPTRGFQRQRRAPYQPGPTAQVTDAPIPEALQGRAMADRWDGPSALLKWCHHATWAVGPGWYDSGPLALRNNKAPDHSASVPGTERRHSCPRPRATNGQTIPHRPTRSFQRQRRAPYQPGPSAQVTDAPIPEAL